jgi:hypothetical protein
MGPLVQTRQGGSELLWKDYPILRLYELELATPIRPEVLALIVSRSGN